MAKSFSLSELRDVFADGRLEELSSFFQKMDAADIAEFINDLPHDERDSIFQLLDLEQQAEVLAELGESAKEDVREALTEDRLVEVMEHMAPDDQADLLADLEDVQRSRMLAAMEPEERAEVAKLLTQEEDTAGHIMTPEILALPADTTVQEARMALGRVEFSDPMLYVYVLEPGTRRMLGLLTLKTLFSQKLSATLGEILDDDFVYATLDEDQEEVARKFRKYDAWVMPVLDHQGNLCGRITADDIMDVMKEEADEDLAIRVGAPDIDADDDSLMMVARKRLPWLLITLTAELINSLLIQHMLQVTSVVAIAIFVPAILAMGGNTGTQSATVSVRGVALGSERYHKLWQVVRREMSVGCVLGVVCGFFTALIAIFVLTVTQADTGGLSYSSLGFSVGISMANAMIFAACVGAIIPLILDKLGVDPAVAAGPFITTFNDISASCIYFLTCLVLLSGIL